MDKIEFQMVNALVCISIHTIEQHKEDLFYEYRHIRQALNDGKDYILFTRKHGADGIDRYFKCLEECEEEQTYVNAVEYAKRTLGVEYIFWFSVENGNLLLTIRHAGDRPYMLESDLRIRNINYQYINEL